SSCYVDDIVDALIRLMATEGNCTGPINLGKPEEFTMLDLAKKVVAQTGSSSTLEFRPLPEDDALQRKPDISLAMRELSWKPTVRLDDGLKRTVSYFSEMRSLLSKI